MGNSLGFSTIKKIDDNKPTLEVLFFGQARLLEQDTEDAYYLELGAEYGFLEQKFSLSNNSVIPVQFFRLRPPNFPTIRLSQLAALYHQNQNLFSKIIEINTLNGFYKLFSVGVSPFWESHYTFNTLSKTTKKKF